MDETPHTHERQSSNAFARQRDAQILWLLERHPATAGMLVEVGIFTSKSRASRRLYRLVQRKKLRIAGTVALKDGRPEQVYCRSRWVKPDTLTHEVQISRLCFKIHADDIRRGPAEVDAFLRPDAELVIDGRRFLFECDRGTMSYQTVAEKRLVKYTFTTDSVLWVCSTPTRMEGLRSRAGIIRGTALFTTMDQALRNPHAAIWINCDGECVALPRANGRSAKEADRG
jgi:hypothetical protein